MDKYQLKITIPGIFVPPSLNLGRDSLAELERIPRKTFETRDPINDTNRLMRDIPDVLWGKILLALDIQNLASLMLVCKKTALLTNDNKTRERFFKAKLNHSHRKELNSLIFSVKDISYDPKPLPDIRLPSCLTDIPPPSSRHQGFFSEVNNTASEDLYQDEPAGMGFTMRNK